MGYPTSLDAGADPQELDTYGNITLRCSAPLICNHTKEEKWLPWMTEFLTLGININTRNTLGETALFNYFTTPRYSILIEYHQKFYKSFVDPGGNIHYEERWRDITSCRC
jgi:hypothetical protein